jgi:hypothetical protein
MQPNSAYKLVTIVAGTDYTPVEQFTTHTDPNIGPTSPPGPTVSNGLTSPIYAIFCTVSNTSTTKIQLLGDSVPTDFAAGALKQGVVYNMYISKITDLGGGTFIGMSYQQHPFIL